MTSDLFGGGLFDEDGGGLFGEPSAKPSAAAASTQATSKSTTETARATSQRVTSVFGGDDDANDDPTAIRYLLLT